MLVRACLLLSAGVLLLAAGCGDDGDVLTAKAAAVLSFSGPGEVYGASARDGIILALEEINEEDAVPGVRIDVTFEDDQSSTEVGTAVFERHIADGVSAILGPTLSNTALATDEVAQAAGVPVLAVTNTGEGITEIGDFIFRIPLTEDAVVRQTVARVVDQVRPATAAVLYASDDAFSSSSGHSMLSALAENGVEVVLELAFLTEDRDFSQEVAALLQAEPDLLLVTALAGPAAEAVRQIREVGLDQPLICGNGCNAPAFVSGAGAAAEGVYVGASWNARLERTGAHEGFVEAFTERFGREPDQFAAEGYTGAYVLAEAVRLAGSSERQAIRDALDALEGIDTPLGPEFHFDERRDAVFPAVVQVIRDGEFAVAAPGNP